MRLLEKARQSQLVRSAAILATGTATAQAIAVLASPVLTRLYPPEAFGLYATFLALVSSLTPAATGRYEVALMLPRADRSARELYAVALWFCVFLCATLALLTTAILEADFAPGIFSELGDWALVAPLTLFGVGIFNATTYAANRVGRYSDIARSSVVQATTIAGVNIALGFTGAPFSGLIVGNLVGVAMSLLYLLYLQRDFLRGVPVAWSARKKILARRFRGFPLYNASTGILDGVTANLPVFFIVAFFSSEMAGYFALVIRVLSAPLSVVSASVSRVNLKKVVELANNRQDVVGYVYKAAMVLFGVSAPAALAFIFWGPPIFAFVFGENWREAGEISRILAFALIFKFVSSTLSSTLGATNNNQYGAVWKITAFISTSAVLTVGAYSGSLRTFLVALVLNEIAIYSFYFYLIQRAAKHPRN